MIINGFQKLTLLDYPDHLAAMIFTSGCNFKCSYCQNSPLIKKDKAGLINEEEILEYLKKRKNVLDGLVISGGEPTMQSDLKEFILKVKEIGLKIKLDTNGYKPEVLKPLLDEHLIDYVAMDIKNVFEKYPLNCGVKQINECRIKKSILLIKKSGIDHEFRTTFIKEYHTIDDINKIIELIGDSKYYVQNFEDSENVKDKSLHGLSEEELSSIKKILCNKYPNVKVRGL